MTTTSSPGTPPGKRTARSFRSPWAACTALLAGMLVLAACDSGPTPTPITQPQATPTSEATTVEATATHTPTRPPIATATPAPPTSTPTLEPSPTASSTATDVPLPAYTFQSLGLPEDANLRDIAILPGRKILWWLARLMECEDRIQLSNMDQTACAHTCRSCSRQR